MKNNNKFINLNMLSTILFIIGSFISLSIVINKKKKINNKNGIYTNKQTLDISFYNRILILIAVLISLYVSLNNYKSEYKNDAKYKSSLILITNILTLIGALIILYVSYLNRKNESLTASDVENSLI